MNVPRLFAAGKENIGQKTFQAHSISHPEGPSSPEITIPTKFYQWRFTKPTAASPEDGYFELQGSKMALTLHF
jgi:hypothetical protein